MTSNTLVPGLWRLRLAFDKASEGGSGGSGDGTPPAGEAGTKNTPPGETGAGGENTGGEASDEGSGGDKSSADPAATSTVIGGAKPGEEPESGDGEGEGGDADGDQGPPEEYAFDELPEGAELDQGLTEKVTPVFKELGLTNTQANQLAAAYAEHIQSDAEARASEWQKTNEQWVEQARKDPEISEMGWDSAVEAANKFIDTFGGAELSEAIAMGVNGNHPAVIRAFAKAGAALTDDRTETGSSSGGNADAPPEERWYGTK